MDLSSARGKPRRSFLKRFGGVEEQVKKPVPKKALFVIVAGSACLLFFSNRTNT
jgi:hypothetical protein